MTNVTLAERRRAGVEWLNAATNDEHGRACGSPFYQWIVEGRDPGPHYSSCADLPHWFLFRVGCREDFINREEHRGWKDQVNVARLSFSPVGSNELATKAPPTLKERRALLRTLEPGDILVTWTGNTKNAHVCVFEQFDGDYVYTWDLGGGPLEAAAWANKRDHLEARKKARAVGLFPLKSVLRLADVPFTGELDLPSGERLEALGAYGR